jgi:parvulin-like peptidyl-prolyl isomerase
MSELDNLPEPKDRTKLIWGAFIAVFVVMILAIWWAGKINPNQSVARVKHILIAFKSGDPADQARAADLIRALRERIVNGENFGNIAEEYSNDPGSATRGGDLGYVTVGELTDKMDAFAWTAPVGELSDVIQTGFGYHIAIVTDRKISDADRVRMREDRESRQRLQGEDDAGAADSAESAGEAGEQ